MTIPEAEHPMVLAALYNASAPIGMGFMQYNPNPMTEEEAKELLTSYKYFDYLYGRLMKVSFESEEVSLKGYSRDNGENWAEMAIDFLYATEDVNCAEIQEMHKIRLEGGKAYTRKLMNKPTEPSGEIEGVQVIHLGLDDVADILGPIVDNA